MKISVIVPVYKAEKYLSHCIDSILRQTEKNFELILVDDGSPDNCPAICDNYEKKDSRVKVIHQKNAGPGIARNNAMTIAKGEYIVFVDSDDYIEPDYFELLVQAADGKDIVFINVQQVSMDGRVLKQEPMSQCENWGKDKILRRMLTGYIPWGGVRKVIKRELLEKYDVKYTPYAIGEEAAFSFKSLFYANSLGFIPEKAVYNYVIHSDSQSNLKTDDPWGAMNENIKEVVKSVNAYSQYANTLNALFVSAAIISIDRIAQNYSFFEARKRAKQRIDKFWNICDNDFGIDTNSLALKAKLFIPFLKFKLVTPIIIASYIKNILK